jgi:prephenate dehydratase
VISHPQALGQCVGTLRALGVKTEPVYDTAGGVKMLKGSGERPRGPSLRNARLRFMKWKSCKRASRTTRRITPASYRSRPHRCSLTAEAKTSIVFTLKNQPGALFKALSVFALRDIDLTKIESRPLAGKPWEYLFYIDFSGATGDETVKRALDHLGEYALMLRVLGSYPRFTR